MKKQIILITLVLCCTYSCKKSGDGYVKGTVYEIGTSIPYNNAVVYFLSWKNETHGIFPDEILDSMVTNNSGEYNFPYHKKRAYGYAIHCKPHDFFTDNSYLHETYFELEYKETTKDIYMYPTANMKIHLQKNSSSTNTVTLFFNGIVGPEFRLPNYNYPFDTILQIYKVRANTEIYLEWYQLTHESPFQSIKHENTLYINKGDTLQYSISYN